MIHPSNRYAHHGVVSREFDPLTGERSIDWFFRDATIRAVVKQAASAKAYAVASDMRRWNLSSALIKEFAEDARRVAFEARASLFILIGDGTPWTDPTGKLTLWEGAT